MAAKGLHSCIKQHLFGLAVLCWVPVHTHKELMFLKKLLVVYNFCALISRDLLVKESVRASFAVIAE